MEITIARPARHPCGISLGALRIKPWACFGRVIWNDARTFVDKRPAPSQMRAAKTRHV